MSHDWEDVDQLLSAIDEETDAEARAFEDTGGSGVLLAELLGADEGPFPNRTLCTFNGDESRLGEYPAAWRPLSVNDVGGTFTLLLETLQPVFTEWAKAAGEVIMSLNSFIETVGFTLVNGRWVPIPKSVRRPFPTRKGLRTERQWHRRA
jgi:hypothetical protein